MPLEHTDVERMRVIEQNWNARTPIHLASRFYQRDAAGWFASWEWLDIGEVAGRDLVHLQCHLGSDTIEFARRGARTVGLDISGAAVAGAREFARRAGVEIDYVQANVYDAVQALGNRKFDLIYTGKGALCYLPDLDEWARTVAALLKPGGKCYLVEFHPLLNALGPTAASATGEDLVLHHDYLEGRGAIIKDHPYTYTDGPAMTESTRAFEWRQGIGAVANAFIGAGLTIAGMRESEQLPWPRWSRMLETSPGWWTLPDGEPRIPLMFAVQAVKPTNG